MLGDDVALKRDNALPCRTRSLSIVRRSGRALKVRVGSTSTKLIVSRTSPLSLRNSPSKRFLEGVLKGRLVHLTVRIAPLFQAPGPARVGAGQVTFEPGAHTAWHTLSSVRLLTFRSVVQVGQRKVLWLCSPGASYVVGPAPPGFSASRIDACKSVRVLVLVHEDMIEAPSDLLREHGIRHQRTPTAPGPRSRPSLPSTGSRSWLGTLRTRVAPSSPGRSCSGFWLMPMRATVSSSSRSTGCPASVQHERRLLPPHGGDST